MLISENFRFESNEYFQLFVTNEIKCTVIMKKMTKNILHLEDVKRINVLLIIELSIQFVIFVKCVFKSNSCLNTF